MRRPLFVLLCLCCVSCLAAIPSRSSAHSGRDRALQPQLQRGTVGQYAKHWRSDRSRRNHAAPSEVGDPSDFNFPQVRLLFASFGLPLSQMQEPNFTVAVQETLQQLSGVPEEDTSLVFIEWYAVEAMILADSESEANSIAANVSDVSDEEFTAAMQANLEDKQTTDGELFGLLSATQTIAVVPVSGQEPEVDLRDTNDILRENVWPIVGVILALLVGAGIISWFLSWGLAALVFLSLHKLLPTKKQLEVEETKEPGGGIELTVSPHPTAPPG